MNTRERDSSVCLQRTVDAGDCRPRIVGDHWIVSKSSSPGPATDFIAQSDHFPGKESL
jgi:hypothetical protein